MKISIYQTGDKILLSNVGDVYYDLAKMYGGILMSYKLMKDNENFSCFIDQDVVNYNHKSDSMLDKFKPTYEKWITKSGYDLEKVKLITALIYTKENLEIYYFLNRNKCYKR